MRFSGLAVVLLGVLAACSSSNSNSGGLPAACTAFSACGGNVVGSWHLTAFCGPGATQTQSLMIMGCTGATLTSNLTATGTIVFNADSSYTAMTTTSGTGTAVLPNSCLNGSNCADLQTNLGSGVASATCTGDNTNCTCKIVFSPLNATSNGTYTVSGNTLTTSPNGGAPESDPYCVNGNQLSLQSTDASGVSTILVATK